MIRRVLFDLDDTLYPASAGLMDQISHRMNEFMVARLGIPADDVTRIRQDYWQRYGTTLRGLYVERHIDAQAFLDFVHDIDVDRQLKPDLALDAMLTQLSQDKYIFTNSPASHARRVLAALGVTRHYKRIFDINFIQYESKPNAIAYTRVLDALGGAATECLMLDDSVRNLVPAHQLGMQTVLLDGRALVKTGEAIDGVDEIITSLYDLSRILG